MRKLLVLLLFLPLMATAKIPVEEDIIRQTLDSESPYYYPNLAIQQPASERIQITKTALEAPA